jgi:ArsR family transcriptional regulator
MDETMTSPGIGAPGGCCGAREDAAARCCPALAAAEVERLTLVAKALSDPIRLGMLDVMAQGRACCGLPEPSQRGVPGASDPAGVCVCDLQEHFGLGQSKVSYHLRVLREAGIVREEARGKWSYYSIDGDVLAAAVDTLRDLARI